MVDDVQEGEVSEEQVAEATSLGWAPKENWRGPPEKWIDAKTYLDRGMGIHHVRDQNKKMAEQVNSVLARQTQLESALQAANTTIAVLEESHADDVKEQVEAARTELREEIERASREGDHAALATATDKLTQLNVADKDAGGEGSDKGGDKGDKNKLPPLHPEVVQWFKDNPDFSNDMRRIALARVEGEELRKEGNTEIGKAFMDAVAERVDKLLGKTTAGRSSKAEGGTRSGGGSGGGGESKKTYADLPADAKAACDKQAARLVGPNRAHKSIESWRNSYTRQYFTE